MLQYLIREAGVPIDTETTPNRDMALHLAAKHGSLEVVTWLVKEAHANVDASDHKGETALHMALAEKQAAVALFLMREGKASLEAKSVQGLTPLMHACVQGMLECVRFLVLEKAVDVGAKDSDGLDAAFHAAGAGHVDDGFMAHHVAALNGHLPVLQCLIQEAGVPVDTETTTYRDTTGFAPRGREWQLGDGDLVGEGGTCECPSTG